MAFGQIEWSILVLERVQLDAAAQWRLVIVTPITRSVNRGRSKVSCAQNVHGAT